MTQVLPDKNLVELQRRFKHGYTVQKQNSGHFFVIDPNGEKVLKPGKATPISLPGTPSNVGKGGGWYKDLEDAGVLRTTPRKVERANARRAARDANGNGVSTKDARRIAWEAMNAGRIEVRKEEAQRLHARLTPLVEKVGGWDQPGMPADLAAIGALIARETGKQNRRGMVLTPDLLTNSIHRVKKAEWIEPDYQEVWNDLASRLEAAPKLYEEFFRLLRRAKGLPEEATPIATKAVVQKGDWPFRIELIDLERCMVDHSYQRPVDWLWVRKTAATFDPTLVGAVDVSSRHAGASLALMDGQGRWEVMKLVGKEQAYAAVYEGLDVQAEAIFFLDKNRNRKSIHPFYTYQARLTAKDEVAVALANLTEQFGYEVSIVSASNRNIPEKISAISSLEEAYKRKNDRYPECLSPTLAVLRRATFGLKEGNSAFLLRGIARLFEQNPFLDELHLGNVIQERSPTWLLARMRELGWATTSNTPAMVAVLIEEYNHGLPRSERLAKPK